MEDGEIDMEDGEAHQNNTEMVRQLLHVRPSVQVKAFLLRPVSCSQAVTSLQATMQRQKLRVPSPPASPVKDPLLPQRKAKKAKPSKPGYIDVYGEQVCTAPCSVLLVTVQKHVPLACEHIITCRQGLRSSCMALGQSEH